MRLLQVLTMESQSTCAICGKNAIHKCSACGNVYYCSKQHQKEDWRNHAKACKSFKVSITEFGHPHPSYQCITVIRALASKDVNLESYKKLLSLESHCDRINSHELSNTVRFIKRFFKTDDISEEEMTKIVGILQVNGHEVPLTDPPYVAVYERTSLLEHNCKANCSKSFTDTGGLIIHAAVPIAKGDHISICYTDPLWGTANRRHHLLKTKFFECTCDRCKDPTEFGTMFNALKCNRMNCPGYILPKTFFEQEQDYTCKICESIVPYVEIEKMLENIGIYLSTMKKNDIIACKEFISRYESILHPNHFYNIDVTIALAQLIGQQTGGLAAVEKDLLIEKIELCKKLDKLLKTLVPAENRIRGLILFELHAAHADLSRRHTEMEILVPLLQESKKYLVDGYQLLKYEPKVLPEGKIAQHAEQNLHEINKLLKRFNVT
ncbi:SET domain-containing protein SmydA-8-like isoform X6 [Bombus pyrosoma]|uniref:SET domain-containing protein SmydA-8-like isoform X6 n=1 Tax=Bombus pyrosoma TaxID=396416 RepID=UPI001CB909BA|nr:SET domain-containing protein SmydA-8-like isoform X6 [Bombus pyrosoma]